MLIKYLEKLNLVNFAYSGEVSGLNRFSATKNGTRLKSGQK